MEKVIQSLALNRDLPISDAARKMILVIFFLSGTTLGAFVEIPLPFTPVPITLQTLFVLTGAAVLGSGLGAITQFFYMALGGFGLPIFAGGAFGLSALLGPTAGYLAGFIISSLFVGWLSPYFDNFIKRFSLMLLGSVLILSSGTLYLVFYLRISFTSALFLGFVPFVIGDLIKCAVGARASLWLNRA